MWGTARPSGSPRPPGVCLLSAAAVLLAPADGREMATNLLLWSSWIWKQRGRLLSFTLSFSPLLLLCSHLLHTFFRPALFNMCFSNSRFLTKRTIFHPSCVSYPLFLLSTLYLFTFFPFLVILVFPRYIFFCRLYSPSCKIQTLLLPNTRAITYHL